MFFFCLILFLLGYFVIWPLLKGYLLVRKVKTSFFNQANNNFNKSGKAHKSSWHTQYSRKRKIIDPNVGEYVKFQEISVESSTYTETIKDIENCSPKYENQISEADWEDI